MLAGINRRGELILSALGHAYAHAIRRGAVGALIAGDLMDSTRPRPQTLARAQAILQRLPTIIATGNHDQDSEAPTDHALGPLSPVASVVDEPRLVPLPGGAEALVVPFARGQAAEVIEAAVLRFGARGERPRALVVHAGVADESTPFFLKGAADSLPAGILADLARQAHAELAVAGNWHEHRVWRLPGKPPVLQVGATAPTGWNNPGVADYGWAALWHPGAPDPIEPFRVPGPRFLDAASDEETEDAIGQALADGVSAFIRRACPRDDAQRVARRLVEAHADGVIAGWLVEPARPPPAESSPIEARALASEESFVEAAARKHKPPEGVDAEAVVAVALAFLKKAKEQHQ